MQATGVPARPGGNKGPWQETSSPMRTGIRGRCPRCQQGHLFRGFLTLRQHCEVCGLDYSFADPADGPAFFAMSIVGVPALVLAVWLDMAFDAPYWVHFVVTFPFAVLACMALLRPFKGWLVCSQYFYKAEQAELVLHKDRQD